MGSRGSGKSGWLKKSQYVKAKRLIVWDLMREYGQQALPVKSLSAVFSYMRGKTWKVAYQPESSSREAAFDLLCKATKEVGNCTMIVEELAFITKANRAPPAWRDLCLLGRHDNISIIGLSQRPASMDKDFLGVCDVIHSGRLSNEADAKAVATYLECDWRELVTLPDLHYIEKQAGGQTMRGILRF